MRTVLRRLAALAIAATMVATLVWFSAAPVAATTTGANEDVSELSEYVVQDFGSGLALDTRYPKNEVVFFTDDHESSFALKVQRPDTGTYDGMLLNYANRGKRSKWAFVPRSWLDEEAAEALLSVMFGTRAKGINNDAWFRGQISDGRLISFGDDVDVIVHEKGHLVGFGDRVWNAGGSQPRSLSPLGEFELVDDNGNGLLLDQYEMGHGASLATARAASVGVDPIKLTRVSEVGDVSAFDDSNLKFGFKLGGAIGIGGGIGGTLVPYQRNDGSWDIRFDSAAGSVLFGVHFNAKPIVGVELGAGLARSFVFSIDPNNGDLTVVQRNHLGLTLDSLAAIGFAFVENLDTGEVSVVFNGSLLGASMTYNFNSPDGAQFSYKVPFSTFEYNFTNWFFDAPPPTLGPIFNPPELPPNF